MALSGVRDSAETVIDVITDALFKISVQQYNEPVSAADAALGLRTLRRMLRSWATDGVRLWLTEEQTITLAADTATYTLDPRTLDVSYALRRSGGNDTPIRMFTRQEYQKLPNKTVSGAPYAMWHDRQYNQSQVTVYPVPSVVGDTVILTTKRQIQDVTALTNNMEIPPEWSEAAVYNLAVRLAPDFKKEAVIGSRNNPDSVAGMAATLYRNLSAQDREGSVKMRPARWAR